MTAPLPELLDDGTQPAGDPLLAALRQAFLSHAIDNRGRLNSGRQAQAVSLALFALARDVLQGTAGESEIREEAHALATEGLAMSTARAMLATLADPNFLPHLDPDNTEPGELQARFQQFSLQFMEHLANGREQHIHQAQEQSRVALQTALHLQLQQQRALRLEQEWRAEKLNEVLQLNSELARLKEEQNLLLNAVQRIQTMLELESVAIYGWQRSEESWVLRATAGTPLTAGDTHPGPAVAELLRQINAGRETAHSHPTHGPSLRATRLSVGRFLLGVLLTAAPAGNERDLDLLLNAFALSVATNWRNVQLFNDSRQRTRELEILHGRYVDDIWQTPGAYLHARHDQQTLSVERVPLENGLPVGDGPTLPLVMGDRPLGQIQLPAGTNLSQSDREFLEAIVHEMGSALYNARLIQATRSYSMQLQAAAEVSRTISTLLDEETLLTEVVNLIQRRFALTHVALYLLHDDEAVLRASTDPAPANDRLPVTAHHLVTRAMATARPAVSHPTPDAPATGRLALPLQARGAVIGALELHSRRGGGFSPEETAVLQSLAGQVAVAVDNASLFAQVQENYLRVNQLYQAGQQINAATRPAGVFQALVNFAAAGRYVDVAFAITPDPHAPAKLLATNFWSRQEHMLDAAQQHLPRAGFMPGEQSELSTLVDENAPLDPATRQLLAQLGVQAVTFLPIATEDQWSGSLVIGRMAGQPFSDSELQPFRNLCGQAGVALANQLLLRETNALYFISQALNQALTADEALESTLEQIGLYTGISPCRLVLYDEDQQEGHIASVYAPHQPEDTPTPARLIFPMNGDALFEELSQATAPLLVTRDTAEGTALRYLDTFALDAALLIPLRVQQHLAGFMALDSNSGTRPFTLSNRNFAQNAVGQLTIFLENISLFDETTQRAQDLIRLNQIGARLAGILELDQLLPVLYDELRGLLPVDFFLIAQYDHQAQRYTILHHVVDGRVLPAGESRPLPTDSPWPQLFAGQVPLHGETALQLAAIIPPDPLPPNTLPPQSALWVGLQEENHPAGFISIQSHQPAAYSDTHIQLFRSVATQAGLALTNARLFRQTQENVAEFRTLFTVSQAAASSVEAAQRLDNMTRALHEGLQKASVIIYTLDPAGEQPLQIASTAGALVPAGPPPAAQSLSGQVLRLGQPLLVNDLRELPHLVPEVPGAAAQLSVPLNISQRTIGVITAVSEEIGRFTDRDLRLLETLSISVAATLESTRLFENIQAANERLSELDRLKTRFLANMTHELRTPLNAIIGFSRVILKGIDGPITPEQEEDLNAIHRSGQHLLVLINDILDLAKIEAGKVVLVFEPVDLREVAEGVLSTVRGLLADRPVALKLDVDPDLPSIEGDELRLRQVLLNLLANAARYTNEGEIRCCITLEDEEHVLITVIDTGEGIAEQDHDRLFRAFEQADSTSRTGQGTGLGLPISQSLVEMHNGRIWFESEVGKGSTFYVRLPVRQPEGMTG